MKLFITGATGFVGTWTVRRLVERGHETRCLVRASSRTGELRRMGLELVPGDLGDSDSLLRGMRGVDGVVNIAAAYSFWLARRRDWTDVNVAGTRNVMECALEARVSKVVHVSSLVVYGKPAQRPFTERSAEGPRQFSEYARTKRAGDRIAWELHATRGLPLPRLRLPAGPAMASAALLTALSRLTRRPPPWGMARDQMRTMKEGAVVDGGKAARELGIAYTPIRTALEEAVAALPA